jgi:hypothetical protein
MRWHEWLFQPSVSPAATSSTGVPRWPATSHTGASLQHCTSIIIPRLARYWPSLPGSALVDSSGRHSGSKTSSPSLFHFDHSSFDWRGNGRASQGLSALVDSLGSHLGSKTSSFPPTGEVLAEPLGSSSSSTSPLVRHWPSLWEASLLRQPSRIPRR